MNMNRNRIMSKPSGRKAPRRSRGALLVMCLGLALLLLLVGVSFQIVAVHRMDGGRDAANTVASDLRGGGVDGGPLLPAVPIARRRPQQAAGRTGEGGSVITPAAASSSSSSRPVIAYVVTLTGCGDSKRYTREAAQGLVTQGAAVLRHSVRLAHEKSSKYDFEMYAIIHPAARECSHQMSKLGYTALVRHTPFDKKDIQKEFLREHIDGASCCGAKEFIKLYAYTLREHPIAVVLDLDSLILKPLDDLFDAMILGGSENENDQQHHRRASSSSIPVHDGGNSAPAARKRIDAFYTRDYNMVNPGGEKYAGIQGGFLMVRPSEAVFEEYIDIVLEGDYREGQGWGGKYGYFFGGMQIQGICAYFYGERHPEVGLELNRCRINSMADAPHFGPNDKKKPGQCRDGRSTCEDCRTTDVSDILSAHFTICGKPWECRSAGDDKGRKLCGDLHGEWFRIRRSFEESRTDGPRRLPDLEGAFEPERYFGYCTQPGKKGYLPVEI